MNAQYPKAVRRMLLELLYRHYMRDPLRMVSSEEVVEETELTKHELTVNMHYLSDRGLAEMMRGYQPPWFSAVRITADGIDLVENEFEFSRRFPPWPVGKEARYGDLPALVEGLVEEVDLVPIDGEARRNLLRGIQYLRDELARPAERWRHHVIHTFLDWIEEAASDTEEGLPSLHAIRERLPR